jgi:ribosome production factor 2
VQSRRALKKTESKVFENPKTILFLRGANTSDVVNDALNDLANITKPFCKKLKKRNAFHPFEARQHLEFLGFKNDCSLFCFGSHAKKRPHNLVIGRHYDFHVLDMVELGVVAMDRLEMGDSKGLGIGSIGGKAAFVFEGSEFESDPFFVRLRNLLIDFFRGSNEIEVSLDGVDRVIMVSLRSANGSDAVVAPSDDCVGTKPQSQRGNAVVCFRHYALAKTEYAVAVPNSSRNVKLVDVGPNFDFELRRVYFAPPGEFKLACRVPKEAMAHLRSTKENVAADVMGNLKAQLHMGKQDMQLMNLRKFKAHRKQPRQAGEEGRDGDAAEVPRKRPRQEKTNPAADFPNMDTDI